MTDIIGTRGPRARTIGQVRWIWLVVSAALLGVLSGVLWSQLAQPGSWEVRDTGIVLTEEASRGQFSVIVVYTAIAAIAALLWAAAMTVLIRSGGWPLVAGVVVGSTVAGVIAWQVGMVLGPPPPETVEGLSLGDRVPDELRVDGIAPFLVWPISALVGVLLGTWGQSGRIDDAAGTSGDDAATYGDAAIAASTAPVADTRA